MLVTDYTLQLRDLIKRANHISLLTPELPSMDTVHALIAWRNGLNQRNKSTSLFAPQLDTNPYANVSNINEVQTVLPDRRTVIKVGIGDQGIKKVSYEVKEGNLYFYIIPRSGRLEDDQIEIYAEIMETDLLITLGVSSPEQISQWPHEWAQEIRNRGTIVNIDTNGANTQFGQINLVDSQKGSLSELSYDMFKQLNWELDADTSTLLLQGIVHATENFKHRVNADVFENVARLLRQGAQLEKGKSELNGDKTA
ncbi:hypothetical protein HGA91_06670 [candidate division WWE3 bacterium]|nr:hypothetical protein [candidate division WWE3 bacterium]